MYNQQLHNNNIASFYVRLINFLAYLFNQICFNFTELKLSIITLYGVLFKYIIEIEPFLCAYNYVKLMLSVIVL